MISKTDILIDQLCDLYGEEVNKYSKQEHLEFSEFLVGIIGCNNCIEHTRVNDNLVMSECSITTMTPSYITLDCKLCEELRHKYCGSLRHVIDKLLLSDLSKEVAIHLCIAVNSIKEHEDNLPVISEIGNRYFPEFPWNILYD